MTQITPNLSLTKPGGGSTGLNTPPDRVDIDVLNDNFDKIDAGVGDPDNQNRQWYGPAAQIGTLPVTPKDGDTYQESDSGKRLWRRMGGTWVAYDTGLIRLRPNSVTGGTLNADGSVSGNGASAVIDIDGVFSSAFRHFKVVGWLRGAAAFSAAARFRRAGVDVLSGGTDYGNQRIFSNSGAVAGSTTSSGGFDMVSSAVNMFSFDLELFNLNQNMEKSWMGKAAGAPTLLTEFGGVIGAAGALAAVDGLRLYSSGPNFLAATDLRFYALA